MCVDLATIVHFADARLDSLANLQEVILSTLSDFPDVTLTSLREIQRLLNDEVENATQLFTRSKDVALEAMTAQHMLVKDICEIDDPLIYADIHGRKAIWNFLCGVTRFNDGVTKPPAKTDGTDIATDADFDDGDVLLKDLPALMERKRKRVASSGSARVAPKKKRTA